MRVFDIVSHIFRYMKNMQFSLVNLSVPKINLFKPLLYCCYMGHAIKVGPIPLNVRLLYSKILESMESSNLHHKNRLLTDLVQ